MAPTTTCAFLERRDHDQEQANYWKTHGTIPKDSAKQATTKADVAAESIQLEDAASTGSKTPPTLVIPELEPPSPPSSANEAWDTGKATELTMDQSKVTYLLLSVLLTEWYRENIELLQQPEFKDLNSTSKGYFNFVVKLSPQFTDLQHIKYHPNSRIKIMLKY